MAPLSIILIAGGALLILGGAFLKPIWRATVRPFYRHPEAQEPSRLGWGVRSVGMILTGTVVIVGAASLVGQGHRVQPSSTAVAHATCVALLDQVGSPSTSARAEKAVTDAAHAVGYDVNREESSSDSDVELPNGESTVTVDVVTWTVTDGAADVATFTWASSGSIPGRFSATCAESP